MDPLNLKYSKGILIALLEKGKVNKKVLQPYASNTNTLDDVLDALEQSNLISKKQDVIGRRVYEISLTSKGIAVAKQLQKADDISHDKITESRFLTDEQEMLLFLLGKPEHDMDSLVNKFPGAYGAVKYLAGFGLVSQKLAGEGTASVNRIYLTEKGKRVGQSLRRVKLELER